MGTCASSNSRTIVIPFSSGSGLSGAVSRMSIVKKHCDLDARVLHRSWACLVNIGEPDDLYEFGVEIYEEIFAAAPDIVKFFSAIKQAMVASTVSIEAIQLREIGQFRVQALRLVNVFALCVRYATELDHVIERLHGIGRRHRLYLGDILKKAHFQLVQDCTMVIVIRRLESQDFDKPVINSMTTVWNNLLDFIVNEIMTGYNSSCI